MAALPQRAGTGTVAGNLREALAQLGRLRADLMPLELWLRSDPEHSRDLAAAMMDLGKNVGVPHGALAGGALAGLPGGVSAVAGQHSAVGELPGPPQFVAQYLAAERELARVRPATDPERVAVLLLLILFGVAMTPAADGHGLDDSLIGFALETILDGIGPE